MNRRHSLAVLTAGSALLACGQILGFTDDPHPLPADAGAIEDAPSLPADSGADLDATNDAHLDVALDTASDAEADALRPAAGTLDTSFGNGGLAFVPLGLTTGGLGGQGLAVEPGGRILLCGDANPSSNQNAFAVAAARLESNGDRDHTFGAQGLVLWNIPGRQYDVCHAIKPLSGGAVAIAGFTWDIKFEMLAVKLTAQGFVDPAFAGGAGYITPLSDGTEAKALGLVVHSDESLTVGGGATSTVLVHLTSDGTIDKTFGGAGTGALTTDTSYLAGLSLYADGRIAIAPAETLVALRASANGIVDTSYGPTGRAIGAGTHWLEGAGQLAVQPDDRVVLCGKTTPADDAGAHTAIRLTRFTSSGALDSTFGQGGIVTTAFPGIDASCVAVALTPDGKIVIAASLPRSDGSTFAVARYTAKGDLDTTFANVGYAMPNVGLSSLAQAIAVDSEGRILVGGAANDGTRTSAVVARFWP